MGILLDGASYKEAYTTHDRELGQIDVLKGLGWRIVRLWSMDWWENKTKEVNNILKTISEIEADRDLEKLSETSEMEDTTNAEDAFITSHEDNNDEFEASVKVASASDITKKPNKNTSFEEENYERTEEASINSAPYDANEAIQKEYQEVELYGVITSSEQFLNPANISQIKRLVQKVIDAEAPICDTLLMRRVLQSVGIERAGNRLQKHFDIVYSQMGLKSTINGGRRVLWKPDGIPNDYKQFRVITDKSSKRDAKEVPIEEAANAACYILYEEIALGESDLRKEAARIMGFNRMGRNVVDLFDEAIRYCLKNKRIEYGNMENMKLTDEWADVIRNYLS